MSKRTTLSQGVSMGMLPSSEALGRMVGPLWAGFAFYFGAGGPYFSASLIMVIGLGALGALMMRESRQAATREASARLSAG